MRKALIIATLVCLNCLVASAQSWTFARDGVEYVIDLPSATWRVVPRVDVHEHVEFVNGNDEANGYLRLSKILVDSDTTAANLFQSDEKWNLQRFLTSTLAAVGRWPRESITFSRTRERFTSYDSPSPETNFKAFASRWTSWLEVSG